MKRILISIVYFISSLYCFSLGLEIPLCDESDIINHHWYSLKYNEIYEQPYWAAYELTREELEGITARKDNFRTDPLISTGSAELSDYRGSGYDRGHLVPAGDLKISVESMDASFYLSNISPQEPGFNRGVWLDLENYVRTWAWENESIYIVTGPIFMDKEPETIGENKVAVPDYFFKSVLVYNETKQKAISFILPNIKIYDPLINYTVSIDEIEEITGEDLFPKLPDEIEQRLESNWNTEAWIWEEFSFLKKENDEQTEKAAPLYWINSSSGTRHNSNCEYYGNTKHGYYTDKKTGIACGRCGG